ncbi:MAG: hypothetical protein FK733_19645 [Asgard group archaeon]|nr:hypothetical protein [Asgard group archaeon]
MANIRKVILLVIIALTPFVVNVFSTQEYLCLHHPNDLTNTISSYQPIDYSNNIILPEDDFGDQRMLGLFLPDWQQIRATLLAEGNYCYVYMANETIELLGESNSITKCEAIRDAFDIDVYPKALELAGHPNGILGDIDGDPKLTIFLAPLVRYMGTAYLGYYHFGNDIIDDPNTNLREMVYCDSEREVYDTICTIIHEFNHLIWYNNDWDESQFLTEGLANYAIGYTGYDDWVLDAVTDAFTYYPEISLLYFNREYGALWDASYGQAYLFVAYLADRFGVSFTKELVFLPEDAAVAVDIALANLGYVLTFNDIYLDWITACVIDDLSFAEGIYGIESANYTINAVSSLIHDFQLSKTHYYYGFDVKRSYNPRDNFTFVIDNPYPYALGISIILENDTGTNVIQELYWEDTDEIMIYAEGENLERVYIVTSLMSPETPVEYGQVMSLDELLSFELYYNIFEGNIIDTKSVNIFYFFLLYIPIILFIVDKKKKQ